MIYLKFQKPIAIISLCISLVMAFAYGYIVSSVDSYVEGGVSMRSERMNKESLRSQEKSLSLVYEDSVEIRDSLRGYVLSEEGMVDLIAYLESMTKTMGVEFNIVSLDEKKIDANRKDVNMKISIAGRFDQIYKTLLLIENMSKAISIKKMRIDHSDSKSIPWVMGMDLEIPVILNR